MVCAWLTPWKSSSKSSPPPPPPPQPQPQPQPHPQPPPTPSTSWLSTQLLDDYVERIKSSLALQSERLLNLPTNDLVLYSFGVGATSALVARSLHVRYLRRIPNAGWVNPNMLERRRWIKGYVTSVGDADGFRLYHTPGPFWRWPLKFREVPEKRGELKDETIPIRMAGVDAPEGDHFGRIAQPFYEQSKAWLKDQIEGKFVYCQLVAKDQYGRVIAVPHLRPKLLPGWLARGKNLSMEMLRAGWAEVYTQKGAQYGAHGLDTYKRIEEEAKTARRGIWAYGDVRESAAEYKRRHREGEASEMEKAAPSTDTGTATSKQGGFLSRIFGLGRRP